VKDKYAVHSQYFVLVNQDAQLRKMRVGTKLYAMRGNIGLGNFINALQNNLGFDVFA
jgi:hypothetical protein